MDLYKKIIREFQKNGNVIHEFGPEGAANKIKGISEIITPYGISGIKVAGLEIDNSLAQTRTNLGLRSSSVKDVTGLDDKVVSGTKGSNNNFVQWNGDGDAVDSGKSKPSGSVVGTSDSQVLTNKTFGDITFDDSSAAKVINTGTTNGIKIGSGATSKVSLFGATPVVQQTAPASLTDNSGGTKDNAVEAVPSDTLANVSAACNNNFAELTEELNQIRIILINLGIAS